MPLALAGDSGEAIFSRISQAVAAQGYDLQAGTPEYVLARNFAIELYGSGVIQALRVYTSMFLDTAPIGDPLLKKGVDYATPLLPATAAVHDVTFVGAPGLFIDGGTLFQTAASRTVPAQVFSLQMPVTLDGTGHGAGSVQASSVGTGGNVAPDTIRFAANTLTGLTSVTNPNGATLPGTDDEGWETYRARLKLVAARDPGRDNKAYYRDIALAKPGGVEVGWVLVDALWDGPNSIRLVILHGDGTIPSPTEVAAVQAVFDPLATTGDGDGAGGVGDFVTVVAPTEVDLRVRITGLVAASNIDLVSVQDNIAASLADYLRVLVNPGGVVKHRDIENAVHDTVGVDDFGLVEVSRDAGAHWTTDNLPLLATEKAVLDVVEYA